MRRVIPSLALVFALHAQLPAQEQTQPVFRAGVELVTVDIAVVSKDGKPVTSLTAGDFTITAGGRLRRVVSAEFIAAKRPSGALVTRAAVRPEAVPAATTNTRTAGSRTFLFVVDVENIRAGEGRGALQAISDYLDRLDPEDSVGLVSLPYGTPRVDLTTNRGAIRKAAGLIAGASNRDRAREMSMGEATYIARGDTRVLADYLRRDSVTSQDVRRYQPIAERTLDRHRQRTRNLLDSLRSLATAMAPIEGPKAIVLVSEGLKNDNDTLRDVDAFAEVAERARVTLYSLHLESSLVEAAYGVSASTRILDSDVGFDGMADVSSAGRGAAFRVTANATPVLEQIDKEMSGYYLLSFERDTSDRDGNRAEIKVGVSRTDVTVRARTEFTPMRPTSLPAAGAPTGGAKTRIGELLRWPVPMAEFTLDVDTYGVPVAGSSTDTQTVIAAGLATGARPLTALGWEVVDESGKVRADAFESSVPTLPLAADRVLYLGATLVRPGRYRLKLAAIDADGRRASVEHSFEVRTWPAGPLRMSDVILGEVSPAGFRPIPRLAPGTEAFVAREEIRADTPGAFSKAKVRLQLARADQASVLADVPLTLGETADPLKRFVEGVLKIDSLPPGDYVVRIMLDAPGVALQRARLFRK